jgi:hypothetical protein
MKIKKPQSRLFLFIRCSSNQIHRRFCHNEVD